MPTPETILAIVGSLVGIIISIAGLFAGIGYYKQGRNDAKSSETQSANETVELFKNRSDGLEKELHALRKDFESYKKEAQLKEDGYKKTITQQEDLIRTYSDVLKNRNPELEKTLGEIRDYLKELKELKK